MSKLMDEVVDKMKMRHLSRKTVKAYSAKIHEYVIFTGAKQRSDLSDTSKIEKYLTHLATERRMVVFISGSFEDRDWKCSILTRSGGKEAASGVE